MKNLIEKILFGSACLCGLTFGALSLFSPEIVDSYENVLLWGIGLSSAGWIWVRDYDYRYSDENQTVGDEDQNNY